MKYATLDQLKNELEISSDDTSRDDYLNNLLAQVSGWIETYTGRKWGTNTVTAEPHDFVGSKVYLKNFPVTAVTELKLGDTIQDPSTYQWSITGRIYLGTYVRPFYRDAFLDYIKVTYTYGATAPVEISLACVQICARIFRNDSISSESIGDYSVSYKNMSQVAGADQLGILDAHRAIQL